MKTFSRVLTIAAAGAMLAACAKDDGITTASFESIKASVPVPVTFGTYMGETAETRAMIATDTDLQTAGFGVFATYSNGGDYSSSTGPNFMYNQSVTYSSGWTYTPVKYWPNETTQDSQTSPATSTSTDKLSFFAYAPYKAATPSTGALTTSQTSGITALTDNEDQTAPKVSYPVGTSLNEDDLLLGCSQPECRCYLDYSISI